MPTFLYIGINAHGYTSAGAKKAASEGVFIARLNLNGISEYTIFESRTNFGYGMYSLVTCAELSLLCKQISVVVSSHMPIIEGIMLLADQTENKTLKIALAEICGIMEQGYTFSAAMNMYTHIFPTHLVYMAIIGEQSGTTDKVFRDLSDYYAKEAKLRKKIKRVVAYPAMLSLLMGAIILLLIVRVLPVFSDILTGIGEDLPAATRAILAAGNFFSWFIWVLILLIVAFAGGFIYYVRTDKGRAWYARMKLNSFVSRYIYRRSLTARVASSLAILLRSGAPLLNAMEIITPLMDNKFVEKEFIIATERLGEGADIGETFENIGVFPPLFIKMMVMGQKTGKLDEMMDKAQAVFDDEVDDAIERITTMIEPVMIIILSVIVGIILISVMLPIIDLMAIIG